MKNRTHKIPIFFLIILAAMLLTACGEDPDLARFRKNMDDFCTKISEIDSSINNIDAQSENAVSELLGYLDELDATFKDFAALDFPEEFDYLEGLADESSQYMTEAVSSYHEAYSNGSYNEYTAEYARQNYSRSYKRIQIIISFLHGEEPDDADLSIEYNQE
ncbi:hypothetical protein D7X48_02630 [bacterium D16-50]|nr:hypothetical protein [Lachnospiraceae bacterium]RKJ21813.1 hypothetical protein D7X48_02630 [bacterium D16-50]